MEIKEINNKEYEYRYQAVDEFSRLLGAEQVFRGTTVQEVLDKVAEANKNLIKLNRELNRRVRLGEFEKDELLSDATKLTSNLLQPRELTVEEKAQFARDILDPEKFDEVNRKLIESQLGAKPDDIVKKINTQEQRLANIEARQEAEAFAFANPDYYVCVENFKTITSWMVKNNLSPIRENFQLAYDTLNKQGLMIQPPIQTVLVVKEEIPVPVVLTPPVLTDIIPILPVEPKATLTLPPSPSGLTRELSSSVGTLVKQGELTRAMVEKMSGEEYKRRLLTDKTFAKQVNDLYAKKSPENN